MPPLSHSYREHFVDLIPALKGWRACVDSSTQAQVRRHIDEGDKLLTLEEVDQLKTSKPYINGLKALTETGAGKRLRRAEFGAARDLLLVKFSLLTGIRPGPLNNATLEDYDTPREEEGTKVMLVPKHKRSKDGPAILGMDNELQKQMDINVNKIRPFIAADGENNLFVKDHGMGFTEETIGRRLRECWAKSGIRQNERIAHTSIRKLIATKTYEHALDQAPVVQGVLGHSDKTCKQAYVRQQCTKTGAEGMAVIARVTSGSAKSIDAQSDEKQEGQSDEPSIPKRVSSASAKSIDAQSDEMQQGQSAEPSSWEQKTSESQKSADGDTPGAKTSNTKLTDRQKEAATKLFAEKIKKGVKLQLAQARSKMCTCTHLRMLALRKEQSKQLINHINYLIDKRPVASPEALPAISKKRQIIKFENYQSDDGS